MARRAQRRDGVPSGGLLLALPPELQLHVCTFCEPRDVMRLASASRKLRQLSLSPQLWGELELDLNAERFTTLSPEEMRAQHHSLRCWVLARRTALHTLKLTFPGYPHDPYEQCQQRLGLLVASLVATLSPSLRRLDCKLTCYSPWSDCFLPLGPGAPLRELRLRAAHLPQAPDALVTLAGSLTLLSIELCEGFAETQGGLPGLQRVLGRLTGLERLELHNTLWGAAPDVAGLTRLTAVSLAHNWLDDAAGLAGGCSALTGLRLLDLTDCGLFSVPPVIQSLTGLRTLLLGINDIAGEPPGPDDPIPPQGVPLELSALEQLEELALDFNRGLRTVPQAFRELRRLTKLKLGSTQLTDLPPGAYLSSLVELDLSRNGPLPAACFARLAACTALRSLELRATVSAELGEANALPDAIRGLQQLTRLDVGFCGILSFPAGPWAARLEELHADRSCPLSLHASSDAALAALPPLPRLKTLSFQFNAKLGVKAARALLQRAPKLATLWIEGGARFITAPARKLLEGEGVSVVPRPDGLPP